MGLRFLLIGHMGPVGVSIASACRIHMSRIRKSVSVIEVGRHWCIHVLKDAQLFGITSETNISRGSQQSTQFLLLLLYGYLKACYTMGVRQMNTWQEFKMSRFKVPRLSKVNVYSDIERRDLEDRTVWREYLKGGFGVLSALKVQMETKGKQREGRQAKWGKRHQMMALGESSTAIGFCAKLKNMPHPTFVIVSSFSWNYMCVWSPRGL